ncbi:MAG: EAL domain-containing protein, partial [Alphaproteobacteria bacterium]|nr:EAL domain-containing protein [Alphaproteobacteria bacterium]
SLNLKIVSEGVETEGQLNYLIQEGCDVIQGYLFSRPVPADEVEPLLRRGWLTPGKVDVAMV